MNDPANEPASNERFIEKFQRNGFCLASSRWGSRAVGRDFLP